MYPRIRAATGFPMPHCPIGAHLGTATNMDRGWLVAQTGPDASGFRRMAFGRRADCQSIANPRHSRLPVDCQSALRWQCQDAPMPDCPIVADLPQGKGYSKAISEQATSDSS